MPFIMSKRTGGFALETTPYTKETLDATDYDFRAKNVTYSPEIETFVRKYATGDWSSFSSIMGKKKITISFSIDVAWSGTADTPPEWGKLLKACAFDENIFAGTGVNYVTDSSQCSNPATIEIQEEQCGTSNGVVITARGCMGNASLILDEIGQPMHIDFEFTGVFEGIADRTNASIINPTGFDAVDPDAVLSSTITAFSVAQPINTININLGNQVELYVDPSKVDGYRGAYVVNREPTIEMDPYLDLLATNDWFSRWSGGTTGALSMTVGDNITISAPAIQAISAYSAGDRNGFSSNSISGILTRNAGDDELKILQGSES